MSLKIVRKSKHIYDIVLCLVKSIQVNVDTHSSNPHCSSINYTVFLTQEGGNVPERKMFGDSIVGLGGMLTHD